MHLHTEYPQKRIKTDQLDTSFNDLPTDPFVTIFKAIRPKDLYSCSLVNKTFSKNVEYAKNTTSLGETFFEYRFPDMHTLMKKESQTPKNYRCENYNELAKKCWEMKWRFRGETPLPATHHSEIRALQKAKDNMTLISFDSYDTFFWNRQGKLLGRFFEELVDIRRVEIIGKLIYIDKWGEVSIYTLNDNGSDISKIHDMVTGNEYRTALSDKGVFTVSSDGQVIVLIDFNEHLLTLPKDLVTLKNGSPSFNILRIYENYIVILKENRIYLLEIALEESDDPLSQKPFLKRKELKENCVEVNSKKPDDIEYPRRWVLFSKNNLYHYTNWKTDCWDLKTGEKLKSLPESVTPPIVAQGKIVICFRNALSIIEEDTHNCIFTEFLDPEMVSLLQKATLNSDNDLGFDDIQCMDGIITSSTFTISLFALAWDKKTRFTKKGQPVCSIAVFPDKHFFVPKYDRKKIYASSLFLENH